ncbi:hypothetical protein FDG2_2828 [Candidatus Protofrankia californiensis]|uniref:Uncharacterized protein n=1 Tax=Candidatus Protofrankia californiensis TaxID=1839754 RepID=A0A1C3NYE8_9ACTN|nr:hypothetical protein FDG2_2828 [Candidatus Protofrankia californiensis]
MGDFLPRYGEKNTCPSLDTRHERGDNHGGRWFDPDLPDSMELRRRFLPEPDASHVLAHIGHRMPGTCLAEEESGDSRRRELLHASGGYGNLR